MGISITQSKQRSLSCNDLKINSLEAKQVIELLINKYSKMPKTIKQDKYIPNIKDFKELRFVNNIKDIYKIKK